MFEKVFLKAITLFDEEPFILKEYKVSIIDFMSKMMCVYPDIIIELKKASILQIILNISLILKNSIFLQDFILRFINSKFIDQEFSLLVITTLISLFMDHAIDRSNRVFSSFCYRAIMLIIFKSKNNTQARNIINDIFEVNDFFMYQHPYKAVMETP